MGAHINVTKPLGGRIILGYAGSKSQNCVRQMHADMYAGPPTDVKSDGAIRNATVGRSGGKTKFEFTVSMNAGNDAKDLLWHGQGFFGHLRVMWAIGSISDNDGCS